MTLACLTERGRFCLSLGYCELAGIPGLDAKGQEAKRVRMTESEELACALNKE